MQPGCSRGAAEMRPGRSRDAAEVHPLLSSRRGVARAARPFPLYLVCVAKLGEASLPFPRPNRYSIDYHYLRNQLYVQERRGGAHARM